MRVGFGYDVHAFAQGRRLFLGGVLIPDHAGLLGHSDGDVLLHAVSDAILGAAAEGDIGVHFPDTDAAAKGIESSRILSRAAAVVRAKGFKVINIDAVVVCETPRIGPHREEIRETIARILSINISQVSVKGKTTEGLGFEGREEGIATYAVCLLDDQEA